MIVNTVSSKAALSLARCGKFQLLSAQTLRHLSVGGPSSGRTYPLQSATRGSKRDSPKSGPRPGQPYLTQRHSSFNQMKNSTFERVLNQLINQRVMKA